MGDDEFHVPFQFLGVLRYLIGHLRGSSCLVDHVLSFTDDHILHADLADVGFPDCRGDCREATDIKTLIMGV